MIEAARAFPEIDGADSVIPTAREWFTATEIADLRLPGLPGDKRSINRRAADEAWVLRSGSGGPLARARPGRGGGMEYHYSLLPASAQVEMIRRGIIAAKPKPQAEHIRRGSWAWFDRQTTKVKDEAMRRLKALDEINLMTSSGMSISAAIARCAGDRDIALASLWNWRRLIKGVARADWLPALAPQWEGGGRDSDIDPDIWKQFLSDYLRPECPSLASCFERTALVAAAEGRAMPSERTFRRKLAKELSADYVDYKRKGAEHLRRSLPAQRRTVDHLHALQIVNIDGHKFDLNVKSPIDGERCRPIVVVIQDIYSSKILAWCADVSENAIQTQITFGNLFKEYGIPHAVLLDNGRAFASKKISGGAKTRFRFKIKDDEPTGVLTALNINPLWALPYRGQSKPIERAFRDIADHVSRGPAVAGAYTGNSPQNKPHNFGARDLEWDEFSAELAKGFARHNARVGRKGRHYAGRSFDQVFAESYAIAPIAKATPEQLRLALLTAEQKRVNRQTAELQLFGNRYWAPVLSDHRGERVMVRFDPENLHAPVYVYSIDAVFIGEAQLVADNGFNDEAGARESAKRLKKALRTQKEADEAMALYSAGEVAARLPDPLPAITPEPTVIRPVRHRGQTAAALKMQPVPSATPEHTQRIFGALRIVSPGDD